MELSNNNSRSRPHHPSSSSSSGGSNSSSNRSSNNSTNNTAATVIKFVSYGSIPTASSTSISSTITYSGSISSSSNTNRIPSSQKTYSPMSVSSSEQEVLPLVLSTTTNPIDDNDGHHCVDHGRRRGRHQHERQSTITDIATLFARPTEQPRTGRKTTASGTQSSCTSESLQLQNDDLVSSQSSNLLMERCHRDNDDEDHDVAGTPTVVPCHWSWWNTIWNSGDRGGGGGGTTDDTTATSATTTTTMCRTNTNTIMVVSGAVLNLCSATLGAGTFW
jgi:hypothetical protein